MRFLLLSSPPSSARREATCCSCCYSRLEFAASHSPSGGPVEHSASPSFRGVDGAACASASQGGARRRHRWETGSSSMCCWSGRARSVQAVWATLLPFVQQNGDCRGASGKSCIDLVFCWEEGKIKRRHGEEKWKKDSNYTPTVTSSSLPWYYRAGSF